MAELQGLQRFFGYNQKKKLGNHLGPGDISFTVNFGTTNNFTNPDHFWGQTFTIGSSDFLLKFISVRITRGSGDPGDIFLSVRATASGLPVGDDLVVLKIASSVSVPTSAAITKFKIPNIVLKANTQYAFIFRAPSVAASPDNLSMRSANPGTGNYTGGTKIFSINAGSSWSTQSDPDYFFIIDGLILRPDPLNLYGVYARRKTIAKGPRSIKMHFYAPTNPQTTDQQRNRTLFQSAVLEWQTVPQGVRDAYNQIAKKMPLHGYHVFLRRYMLRQIPVLRSTGFLFPTIAESLTGFPGTAWTDVDNIKADLNTFASVNLGADDNDVFDFAVRLRSQSATIGDNKAKTTTAWPTIAPPFFQSDYGSLNDKWGASLDPGIVNASDFGAFIRGRDPITGNTSVPLFGSGYGFNLPDLSVVRGLTVRIVRYKNWNGTTNSGRVSYIQINVGYKTYLV